MRTETSDPRHANGCDLEERHRVGVFLLLEFEEQLMMLDNEDSWSSG